MHMGITRGGTSRRQTLARCAAATLAVGALLLGGLVVPTAASAAGQGCTVTDGPPPGSQFPVAEQVAAKWKSLGGATGVLGQPKAAGVTTTVTCTQSFDGGVISARFDYRRNIWESFVAYRSKGSTGPRWFGIDGDAVSVPLSDEMSVQGGTYQRFGGPAWDQERYVFAPTGGQPFEFGFGFGATPDRSVQMITATRTDSFYPLQWQDSGPVPVLQKLGLPDGPAVCAGTDGGCEMSVAHGVWRFLSVRDVTETSRRIAMGGYQPASPLGKAYEAQGAEHGPLGYPDGLADCLAGDCRVPFEKADLSQYGKTVFQVREPFRAEKPAAIATSNEVCGLRGGYCKQRFTDELVYAGPNGATVSVDRDFVKSYLAFGAENGVLGYPVSRASGDYPSAQEFQGGLLLEGYAPDSATAPAYIVRGGIRRVAIGTPSSPLSSTIGYAAGNEICDGPNRGCRQQFTGGVVWWSPSLGAHAVRNHQNNVPTPNFQHKYVALRQAWGPLGYPLSEVDCSGPLGGCSQRFQGGYLFTEKPGDIRNIVAHWTHGAIGARYLALKQHRGVLGYPTGDEVCTSKTVCYQNFDRGQIWWFSGTGAFMVRGGIQDAWSRSQMAVGAPLQDEQCTGPSGGCYQNFQRGTYWWSSKTGTKLVTGGIRSMYQKLGSAWGRLGYPLTAEYYVPVAQSSGVRQDFQHGSIIWSSGRTTQVIWR